MPEKILELKNVSKRFGDVVAVDNLSIPAIHRGEFITFLGPSGCGKTTLLRMIGGFYYPTSGDILMHGQRINAIPPEKRKTSMVFQNYALFPHMSVFDNIAYGLKIRKMSRSRIREKVLDILTIVRLEGLENRRPFELSGGQQQRVALARCIVIEPEVVLLDEPLSNLDANLRVMMREEIRRIQESLDLTTVFVTHDQEEAMSMSDRIVVMNAGRLEQIGTPTEIYEKPGSLFTACFIGHINLIESTVKRVHEGDLLLATPAGDLVNHTRELSGISAGDRVTAVIRPESIAIADEAALKPDAANTFPGTLEKLTYLGFMLRCWVRVEGLAHPVIVDSTNPTYKKDFKRGADVVLHLPDRFHCVQS
jgi:iron(III) transport system ATP-binding protein